MLKLKNKVIMGIDLAGKPNNPTGLAIWENKTVRTDLLYADKQILEQIAQNKPTLIAIDAPFSFPKKGMFRKSDREMIKKGYRVFPPTLPAMKMLTLRAIRLNKIITKKGIKTIEVHPTSTCKALKIPIKNWNTLQTFLTKIGLKGERKVSTLTSHEVDAILAALTAYFHIRKLTESLGGRREGYIIIPKRRDWRTLKI